jgi:pimeloyl-ACP methyl ester carboxylesterase
MLLLCLAGTLANPLAHAAPVAKIDLDTFDGLKKTVALPNGETLAYVSLGDPAGPPVVLIHGYTDNARDWLPLVPYLSPRFHLIIPDLRGHGRSGKPECCYTRLDFAYDIKLLMGALAVPRADIVGHSLGSIVAQTFAEYWPERTRRVVLIGSTGLPMVQDALAPFEQRIRALKEPIDPDSSFMMEWWWSPSSVDPDLMRRQRRDSAAIPKHVWLAVLEQWRVGDDLQNTLPKLTAPALLIWGSKDPIMTEAARAALRKALPNAPVKVFDGLGHNPVWEDPQAVGAVINTFLTAAPGRAARSK